MARNLYPGYCYVCDEYVPPGFGHFERHYAGRDGVKWRVKCVKCASGRKITNDDPCVKAVQRRIKEMR